MSREQLAKLQRELEEQKAEALAFRFQMKPEQPGLSFYQVRVSTPAEAAVA